ncbi:MAG: L,D-transpeptidase family protein [Rhizomicrobium sp.]|nr:L,D-transpeptidase family protein [Rhizomicrobium sp.]
MPAWTFALRTGHQACVQVAAQLDQWMAPSPSQQSHAIRVAAAPAKPHPILAPTTAAKPVVAQTPATKAPEAKTTGMQLAQPAAQPPAQETTQLAEVETALMPAPDSTPPSPAEVGRVLAHLKVSLTRELYENFTLFLYVSKADHGPWQQRMFAFAKQDNGDLKLMYAFPVSTGKEVPTLGPSGTMLRTNTTAGIYQLDPERMYTRYTSHQWQHKMPFAMFFNWEHDGYQTGLAIHSAVGDDIQMLGKRSSAGCVRLHPQNAELLFRLIKKNYHGLTPRFAYDQRTATMSNEGLLMHDKAGNLQYADGYRVLVLIENNGGDDLIAALF